MNPQKLLGQVVDNKNMINTTSIDQGDGTFRIITNYTSTVVWTEERLVKPDALKAQAEALINQANALTNNQTP